MTASVYITALNRLSGIYRGTPGVLNPRAAIALDWIYPFDAGNASGLFADQLYQANITLAASATQNLDLAGVLSDDFGTVLTMVHVAGITVNALKTNVGDVLIGGAASNAFTGPFGAADNTLAVKPGGVLSLIHPGAGWVVTAGTGDILKVANGDTINPVTFGITIWSKSV